jgi:hypothetical protein
VLFVDGKIRGLKGDFEEIGPAGQMECPGFRELSGTAVKDVGDVVAADGVEFQGIGQSVAHGIFAVDFRQSDDLSHMMTALQVTLLQFPVVIQGAGGQRLETLEEVLILGFFR